VTPPTPEERLARLIEGVSGHVVPPGHHPFLAGLAQQRARSHGLPSAEAYVAALERGALPDEWRELLPRITVKESYLFRTPQHFEAISRLIVPALVQRRAATRRLRAWSAGCARGEEPATLAMVLAEHPALAGWDWRITATDIDPEAIAAAQRGVFNERAVAQVPAALRQRYLAPGAGGWQLAANLQQRIEYAVVNLVQEPLHLDAAPFDLILLRNVLIYFHPASQRRVAGAVAALLAADGALFVGPAETLWQLTSTLVPVDAGGCFFYQRQSNAPPTPAAPQPARLAAARWRTPAKLPAPPPQLATSPPAPPAANPPSNPERLHRATAAAAANRLEEAAALVEEALLADPCDPLAHSLEGLLHDLAGRWQLAVASYRAALFLEPQLVQVRLLLAQCLRRLGWQQRGRREVQQALASLAQGGAREVEELTFLGVPAGEALQRRLGEALLHGTRAP
jgi:chemotaxis protein methyltransferase CheR